MDDLQLRAHLIRLATENPELRAHIVPVLRRAEALKMAHGPVSMKQPDVMLFYIDREANNSKFYEMAVVQKGQETPAKSTKDFTGGVGTGTFAAVLMKRWGRLTDSGLSGRIDSMNEVYKTRGEAERAMMVWKAEKTRKGYEDVSRTREYPIGLGAAGFGWGGQAACTYVPELRGLSGQVGELLSTLLGMQRVVKTLKDRKSGMAEALERHILALTESAGEMSEYLSGQLARCR